MHIKLLFLSLILTPIVLFPFINSLGCDFAFYKESQTYKFNSRCRNGVVTSDIYDKTTNTRVIRKALYGYMNDYSFNIPFYSKEIARPDSVDGLVIGDDFEPFARFDVLNLWSLYSFKAYEKNHYYSFIEDNDGYIFDYSFYKTPKRGFWD